MGNSMRKKVFRRKDIKVLFIGLDSAGKTTLLYSFRGGRMPPIVPTVGYNAEMVKHRHVKVTCWDIGYQDRTKDSMKHYLPGTECIVFVVDSTDNTRLNEAIDNVLVPICKQPEVEGVPVLVLANKQDLDNAMDPAQINFAMFSTPSLVAHPWTMFGISALKGCGQKKALDWMVDSVSKYGRSRSIFRSMSESKSNTFSRNTIQVCTNDITSSDTCSVSPTCNNARFKSKSTFISRLTMFSKDSR